MTSRKITVALSGTPTVEGVTSGLRRVTVRPFGATLTYNGEERPRVAFEGMVVRADGTETQRSTVVTVTTRVDDNLPFYPFAPEWVDEMIDEIEGRRP